MARERSQERLIACIDVPALPLQLYLREHPDHLGHPVAIVDEDRPQGVLLWSNEAARRAGVRVGMRYAAALSLASDLRAGVVEAERVAEGVKHLHARLLRFSPDVEPAEGEPGVFWVNASGLERLYPSLLAWARALREALKEDAFFATVVVGFTRFGTYACARARPGYGVFRHPEEERTQLAKVPIDRLAITPALRDALARLGVRTVGALLGLPLGGLRRRFGPELHRLARLGLGDLDEPLTPLRMDELAQERLTFDFPVTDAIRLLFFLKGRLSSLLSRLAARHEALSGLLLTLILERGPHERERPVLEERVRPASPTLEEVQLTDLLRLKLEGLALGAGVVEAQLVAEGAPASLAQLQLFAEALAPGARRARDLAAASRALARLRARYGEGAVVRARLTEGHLPEARYHWERLAEATAPRRASSASDEGEVAPPTLVRRIFSAPVALPPRPRHEPDGWMLRGLEYGRVVRVLGPYLVSGGWWRGLVQREYCFAETEPGEILWVYYDRRRRRWFLQGAVG